jgi:hypothetical protein
VVLISWDKKQDITSRRKLTRQSYGQDFVSLPKPIKIGGIDNKIGISVNVRQGCVANTEVLLSQHNHWHIKSTKLLKETTKL